MESVPLSSIIRAMEELTYCVEDGEGSVYVTDKSGELVELGEEAVAAINTVFELVEQINCYGIEIDLDIDEEDHATLWSNDSIEY